MCGIHGVVTGSKREAKADDFIKQGFVGGSLRGTDSSGIASIKVAMKDVGYQKLPLPGFMFMLDKYANRLAVEACQPGMINICHTRSATSGGVGLNEAHPFVVTGEDGRELIGVHNGSLTGWHSKPNAKDYKVDSEWALNHIFDEGFDAFEDFSGAFVFVWWDSDTDQVLNIALNEARPLYVAFTEDGNMLFASEAGMLYWLAERNSIKLDGKVLKLLAGFWYKFRMENLKDYTKTALPKPKTTTTTTSHTTHYNRPNHVESVEKLLARIANKDKPTGTAMTAIPKIGETPNKPRTYVKATEVLLAKEAGYMRSRGEFQPLWKDDDNGEIWGTFLFDENHAEMDAIIRNGQNLDFLVDKEIWHVEVIGMNDDGLAVSLVCTHPIRRELIVDRADTAEMVLE